MKSSIFSVVFIVLGVGAWFGSSQFNQGVVTASVGNVDASHEGRLVYLKGKLKEDSYKDEVFNLEIQGVTAQRVVEIYQWTAAERGDVLAWSETLVDHPKNKGTDRIINLPFGSKEWKTGAPKIGSYTLSAGLARQLPKASQYALTQEHLGNLSEAGQKAFKIDQGAFYFGVDPKAPELGDIRISYRYQPAQVVSVLAAQNGQQLRGFHSADGVIEKLDPEGKDLQSMLGGKDYSQPSLMTWICRGVAALFGVIGLFLLLRGALNKRGNKKADKVDAAMDKKKAEEAKNDEAATAGAAAAAVGAAEIVDESAAAASFDVSEAAPDAALEEAPVSAEADQGAIVEEVFTPEPEVEETNIFAEEEESEGDFPEQVELITPDLIQGEQEESHNAEDSDATNGSFEAVEEAVEDATSAETGSEMDTDGFETIAEVPSDFEEGAEDAAVSDEGGDNAISGFEPVEEAVGGFEGIVEDAAVSDESDDDTTGGFEPVEEATGGFEGIVEDAAVSDENDDDATGSFEPIEEATGGFEGIVGDDVPAETSDEATEGFEPVAADGFDVFAEDATSEGGEEEENFATRQTVEDSLGVAEETNDEAVLGGDEGAPTHVEEDLVPEGYYGEDVLSEDEVEEDQVSDDEDDEDSDDDDGDDDYDDEGSDDEDDDEDYDYGDEDESSDDEDDDEGDDYDDEDEDEDEDEGSDDEDDDEGDDYDDEEESSDDEDDDEDDDYDDEGEDSDDEDDDEGDDYGDEDEDSDDEDEVVADDQQENQFDVSHSNFAEEAYEPAPEEHMSELPQPDQDEVVDLGETEEFAEAASVDLEEEEDAGDEEGDTGGFSLSMGGVVMGDAPSAKTEEVEEAVDFMEGGDESDLTEEDTLFEASALEAAPVPEAPLQEEDDAGQHDETTIVGEDIIGGEFSGNADEEGVADTTSAEDSLASLDVEGVEEFKPFQFDEDDSDKGEES